MLLLSTNKAMFVLCFILVTSSLFMGIQGRPLSLEETTGNTVAAGDDVEFINWLGMGGIKNSGPSGGGAGHKLTTSNTLGDMKNSGHKVTTSNTLGGMKNSGPSRPGMGH